MARSWVPSIEAEGTQSYRVRALLPHRPKSSIARFGEVLSVALATLALACLAEDYPEGKRTTEADVPDAVGASISASAAAGATPLPGRARGIWVLAEGSYRVLDDPARIDPLLDRAEALGVTDLFVQVYRGGRAFYATDVAAEMAPLPRESLDPLSVLLERAGERGLRVHAWVNALSLSTRRDALLIEQLGPDAILVDRKRRSLLDYPGLEVPAPDDDYYRMGTRGLYLDPAVPAVRAHLVATIRDLLLRYPDLEGLHLDYIRHPGVLPFIPGSRFGVGLEFGYGAESRARYRQETGNPDPIEGAPPGTVRGANAWDAWRRRQVTTLVEEIAATAREARPGVVVSAAVIAYADRAYLSLAQDWRAWLESGAIDLAMPMVYTRDDRLLGYQLENFAGWRMAARIWPGLGVWLFANEPARARKQLAALREAGFRGEMLFSDDAIAESEVLFDSLVEPAATVPSERAP